MLEYLDDVSEVVYVADPRTYELLYLNDSGKRLFSFDGYEGQPCYRVLQGLEAPCPFCTNDKLRFGENYTWEFANKLTGRRYLLKDRLIEWEGRSARLEVAFDMEASAACEEGLSTVLDAEGVVLQCAHDLYCADDLDEATKNMLGQVGRYLRSDRACVFLNDEGRMRNTSEWCAPGVDSRIDEYRGLDFTLSEPWQERFARGECVIVETLKDVQETAPDEYAFLKAQGIRSLALAPLEQDGCPLGFISIENPQANRVRNLGSLLQTLAYFYLMTVQRIQNAERLTQMSFHDGLTGLYNRNRYIDDIDRFQKSSGPLGVVFLDVNNLKFVNDRYGHGYGDEMLCDCAAAMTRAFEGAGLYRVGGDEFAAIVLDVERERFEDMKAAFERELEELSPGLQMASVGTRWGESASDVVSMLAAADAEMYERKRVFRANQALAGIRPETPDATTNSVHPLRVEDGTLLNEYNMLMSALHVSVSKHLMTDKFEVVWANDFYYEMTGYTREEYEEIFHNNVSEYYANDPKEYAVIGETVQEALEAGKLGYECFSHMPVRGGSYTWIRVVGTFTDEQIDGIPVIYVTFTNVNDVVLMERERSITYDNIPGFIARFRVTPKGIKLLYGNERFVDFFGSIERPSSNQLLLDNLAFNDQAIKEYYPRMLKGESLSFSVEAQSVRDEHGCFSVYADCVDWMDGDPVYLVLYLDTTELIEQRRLALDTMERLRNLAYVDPVTGGRNRTSFDKDAGEAIVSAAPGTYMLVSLDVDKFKVVNDQLGLSEGDAVLRLLYECLEAALDEGEFVGRISADLFSILLKADADEVVAARIEAMVADANAKLSFGPAQSYVLTAKAGVYRIDEPNLPMMQLQDRANVARKQARRESSTRLSTCRFYNNEDRVRLARDKDIENRMRDALAAGEFMVYLQPKLDLRLNTVAGAEALVRWNDPVNGFVQPNDFIPLFERNGFIVDLDLYVFEQVCALLRSWIDGGRSPVPVSVNLSRMHLLDPCFLDRYEAVRTRYGVPAMLIEFELTETLVFGNPQLLSDVIDRIHCAGYSCSMDDFGSGYSSLNVLKDLEVDVLKLDRLFFDAPELDDARTADIIRIAIELARRLHMKTVAEGVETEAQRRFLEEAGCDMIQGYLFSRPVPPAAFEELAFGHPIASGV